MQRRIALKVATMALLVFPVGPSPAQTSLTSSTTSMASSTTTSITVTSTTLPVCVPGQTPAPRIGENCQLPGLECITFNPPPHCPPPAPGPEGEASVVAGDTTQPRTPSVGAGQTRPTLTTTGRGDQAAPRLADTGSSHLMFPSGVGLLVAAVGLRALNRFSRRP